MGTCTLCRFGSYHYFIEWYIDIYIDNPNMSPISYYDPLIIINLMLHLMIPVLILLLQYVDN